MDQHCSIRWRKSGVTAKPIFWRTDSSCFLRALRYLSSSFTSCYSSLYSCSTFPCSCKRTVYFRCCLRICSSLSLSSMMYYTNEGSRLLYPIFISSIPPESKPQLQDCGEELQLRNRRPESLMERVRDADEHSGARSIVEVTGWSCGDCGVKKYGPVIVLAIKIHHIHQSKIFTVPYSSSHITPPLPPLPNRQNPTSPSTFICSPHQQPQNTPSLPHRPNRLPRHPNPLEWP